MLDIKDAPQPSAQCRPKHQVRDTMVVCGCKACWVLCLTCPPARSTPVLHTGLQTPANMLTRRVAGWVRHTRRRCAKGRQPPGAQRPAHMRPRAWCRPGWPWPKASESPRTSAAHRSFRSWMGTTAQLGPDHQVRPRPFRPTTATLFSAEVGIAPAKVNAECTKDSIRQHSTHLQVQQLPWAQVPGPGRPGGAVHARHDEAVQA